jgi:DNA-binding GntR family transcriptional regulator
LASEAQRQAGGDGSADPGAASRFTEFDPSQPGKRANLDDHIYERLKAMIVDGTLLPGERIVPEQLARDMGVSRTPMLSALKRLSQERLIVWRSRRGVFVRRLSKRELALIFEVREMLEGLAARRAAALITSRQVEELRRLFAGIDVSDTPANRRAYLRQDYLFHSAILEIAASPPLSETTSSVNILMLAFGAGLIKSIQDGLTEHAIILDALRRRDPDGAEKAMRAHVHRSVVWLHHEADSLEDHEERPRTAATSMSTDGRSIE